MQNFLELMASTAKGLWTLEHPNTEGVPKYSLTFVPIHTFQVGFRNSLRTSEMYEGVRASMPPFEPSAICEQRKRRLQLARVLDKHVHTLFEQPVRHREWTIRDLSELPNALLHATG